MESADVTDLSGSYGDVINASCEEYHHYSPGVDEIAYECGEDGQWSYSWMRCIGEYIVEGIGAGRAAQRKLLLV